MEEEKDLMFEQEEEEADLVTFSDDEGNEFQLEVVEYFDYEDEEYAVLMEPYTGEEDAEVDVYIMKVVTTDDMEEFLPADDDKMDALTQIVDEMFATWEDEE